MDESFRNVAPKTVIKQLPEQGPPTEAAPKPKPKVRKKLGV